MKVFTTQPSSKWSSPRQKAFMDAPPNLKDLMKSLVSLVDEPYAAVIRPIYILSKRMMPYISTSYEVLQILWWEMIDPIQPVCRSDVWFSLSPNDVVSSSRIMSLRAIESLVQWTPITLLLAPFIIFNVGSTTSCHLEIDTMILATHSFDNSMLVWYKFSAHAISGAGKSCWDWTKSTQ